MKTFLTNISKEKYNLVKRKLSLLDIEVKPAFSLKGSFLDDHFAIYCYTNHRLVVLNILSPKSFPLNANHRKL